MTVINVCKILLIQQSLPSNWQHKRCECEVMYVLLISNRCTELFKDWPEKALNDLCLVSKRNQV